MPLPSVGVASRGVRLAKNDFGSVFPKTAVFGSVSVLLNQLRYRFFVRFLRCVLLNVYDARNDVLLC